MKNLLLAIILMSNTTAGKTLEKLNQEKVYEAQEVQNIYPTYSESKKVDQTEKVKTEKTDYERFLEKAENSYNKDDFIQYGFYELMDYDYDNFEKIINRKDSGRTIIERSICTVTNENLDGTLLNYPDLYMTFSNLKNSKNAKVGDVYAVYDVYNPENNYCDDIVESYDFYLGNIYEE